MTTAKAATARSAHPTAARDAGEQRFVKSAMARDLLSREDEADLAGYARISVISTAALSRPTIVRRLPRICGYANGMSRTWHFG